MDKISALNIMHSIKDIAQEANSILKDECTGNSNRYSWCQSNEYALNKFNEAYEALKKDQPKCPTNQKGENND